MAFAQSIKMQQRFKAGAILGLNAAQVDGDGHRGYRKFGIQTGIRGVAILSRNKELSVELLFSQRGSKSSSTSQTGQSFQKPVEISLSYAEIPVLFNLLLAETYDAYHAVHLHGGISFGRLLNSNVKESNINPNSPTEVRFKDLQEGFQKNDLSLVVGFTFYLQKKIGLTLRHSYSFNTLYSPKVNPNIPGKTLRTYFFSLHALYMISQ